MAASADIGTLFSGGMSGNLGVLIFWLFALLIPNLILFFNGVKLRFYFLKFLQYPGLIIVAFGLFVFFFRRDRWFNADWHSNYLQFSLTAAAATHALSLFVTRRMAPQLLKYVVTSFALGVVVYLVL